MTSISPDRNTVYDYDLSTLSNIRLDNRRAKQKLSNNVLHQANPSATNRYNYNPTRSRKSKHDYQLDETADPIRLFKDSPSPNKYDHKYNNISPFKYNSSISRKYDIDSSLLEKDNLKYLDRDYYSNGSKLNEQKRERFLDSINSANNTKFSNRQSSHYDVSPVRDTITKKPYEDLGFRPRNKDIGIPNLKPDNYYSNPFSKSPIKAGTSGFSKSDIYNDNIDPDRLDRESEEQLRNYDKRFQHLVDKYQLDELSTHEDKIASSEPESKLDRYRSMIRKLQAQNQQEANNNQQLKEKITELEKFIEFLESNFDQLYKRSGILKLEKHDIHRKNQELIFINNYYKSLLRKQKIYKQSEDTTISLLDHKFEDDDSTTQLLINFNTTKPSATFNKLSSIKKFRALGFAVLASVKLQHRLQHRQAYIKKVHDLMGF